MKTNLTQFTLTLFSVLLLSACGSGGGGGGSSSESVLPVQPTEQAKPQEQTNPVEQVKPSEQTKPQEPKNEVNPLDTDYNPSTAQVSGNKLNLSPKEEKEIDIVTFVAKDEYPINKLVVEGKAIDIIPQNLTGGETITTSSSNMSRIVSGVNYRHTRWGYVADPALKDHYLVAQGNHATAIMPSGTAQYKGSAAHLYNSVAENGGVDTISLGRVDITVDFDNKKLTGKIEADPNYKFGADKEVRLAADIKGNKFEGSLNGTDTEGGFYGEKASELTGYYSNKEKRYIGTFGAKKQ